jgi:regulator of nucleoside diphosphate kinase
MLRTPIVISATDRDLIRSLLLESRWSVEAEVGRFLREELDRADTLPDAAVGRAVSMGCEVTFIEHETQRLRVGRVVDPDHVENNACISVLTPVGSALIGLGPGQTLAWTYRRQCCGVTVLRIRVS